MNRRIRRRVAAVTHRARQAAGGRSTGLPPSRVEQAWTLTDGSLVLEGWCVDESAEVPLEARVADGEWVSLFRKHRPDVAQAITGLLDASLGQSYYGFVGRLIAPSIHAPATVHLRRAGETWSLPCPPPQATAIRDELFSFLAIDPNKATPESLTPIADMMRHSPQAPTPQTTVRYQHESCPDRSTVNIVVPLYGQFGFVRNLLLNASLFPYPGFSITLVCDDPGIADSVAVWVERWNDLAYRTPVRLLEHDVNGGFAMACNTGCAATPADYHLLLNSDILVDRLGPDVASLLDCLNQGFSAVAPVLTFPDGRLQHAGMELRRSIDFPGFVLPMHPGKEGSVGQLPAQPYEVPMLSGAAVLMRADVLTGVGGIPRVFGRGDFEDVRLCQLLRQVGPVGIDPRVRWAHVEGASFPREQLGGVPATLAKSLLVELEGEDIR